MTSSNRTVTRPHALGWRTLLAAIILVGIGWLPVQAEESPHRATALRSAGAASWRVVQPVDRALTWSRTRIGPALPPIWWPRDADHVHRRWPLRADPRRWPRLFANTTECTLSFDPVRRRHWWQ